MVVDSTLISTQALISAGAPLAGGSLLGLAAGYALKKVMKFALIGFGLLILTIGFFRYKHWILVNWGIVENQTSVIMSHIAHKAYVVT
jgi:uncharacterized membrane protein (Fun14 family)